MTSRAANGRATRAGMVTPAQHRAHAKLIDAAGSGDLETLRRYVQQGGNLDQMDSTGVTALNEAVLRGNTAFALEALDAGANPAIQSPFSGNSALHIGVFRGRTQVVEKLLARADVGAFVNLADKGGFTALHQATSYCQPEIVRRLLVAGADPATGRHGSVARAMLDLVKLGDVEGSAATMEAFLEREPDPVDFLTSVANEGQSLLHAAASAGSTTMVELMLDHGAPADVDAPPRFDVRTPFHFACAKGKVECMRLLAIRGADIHKQTSGGGSALTLVLQFLKGEEAARALSALIELGLDPDAPEHEGVPRRLAVAIPEARQVLDAHAARRAMLTVAAGAAQNVGRPG